MCPHPWNMLQLPGWLPQDPGDRRRPEYFFISIITYMGILVTENARLWSIGNGSHTAEICSGRQGAAPSAKHSLLWEVWSHSGCVENWDRLTDRLPLWKSEGQQKKRGLGMNMEFIHLPWMVSNSLNTLVEIMKNVQEGVELWSGVFFANNFLASVM